jgi:RLL motif-containing protein 1
VARVMRMLHVQELRRLQDSVNATIVSLQEFTANPKTDARLGRVGR